MQSIYMTNQRLIRFIVSSDVKALTLEPKFEFFRMMNLLCMCAQT